MVKVGFRDRFRASLRGGGGRLMRSDNLRMPPGFFTPDLVRRVLEQIDKPHVIDAAGMPVVRMPQPKPKLRLVESETPNPPDAHARQAEESEAVVVAPHAASPRRSEEQVKRHLGNLAASAAERSVAAKAQIEADRPLFRIAFDRGISIADLARALGQKESTVSVHTRIAGFRFGRRDQLADPLTRAQLLALADPSIPLPELRADRLKRERLAKWSKIKRDKRADAVARRRAEREAAAALRVAERERAKAEARRQREQARAELAAAKLAEKQKAKLIRIREAEAAAVRQTVAPPASREPAPVTVSPARPQPAAARAHPVVVKLTPGAPRWVQYAERVNGAVAFLRARQFTVQRHSRDEVIARWHVSGWTGIFSNEQLVDLALHYGLEIAA